MIATKFPLAPRLIEVYYRKSEILTWDWAEILADGVTINGRSLAPEDWLELAVQLELVTAEVGGLVPMGEEDDDSD